MFTSLFIRFLGEASWVCQERFLNLPKINRTGAPGRCFSCKNDAKTLCFTVISCKNLSKIEVLSYFLINFVRSNPIPIQREYKKKTKIQKNTKKKNINTKKHKRKQCLRQNGVTIGFWMLAAFCVEHWFFRCLFFGILAFCFLVFWKTLSHSRHC